MSMQSDLTFDANFTLIQLVQRLAQEDINLAAALVGLDKPLVQRILSMTAQEQLTLARSTQPILTFRFDSVASLEAVIAPKRSCRQQGFHSALCMASASIRQAAAV